MSAPMHDDDGDLRDPVLRRALENAPDQAAAPDWRLGQSIRALAHEAVAPSLPALPVAAQRPWWQRLLGIGAGGGMPWNAAFATVLVGVLVTVMWQREETPGARLDGPQEKATPAPVPASPPVAEVARPAPVAPPAAPAPAAAAPAAEPSPGTLEARLAESRETTAAAARALDQEEARAKQRQAERERQAETEAAAAAAARRRAANAARREAAQPPAPLPPAPVLPAPPSVAAEDPSTFARKEASVERRAFNGQQEASRASPPRAAAAAAPPVAAAAPSFAALSQWTHLHISRANGQSRDLPRAEARELGALVGSAALAGVGSQPLGGRVEWRIALERNGEVLAVLELAGARVRWRENGASPGTGAPGAGALSALRAALEEASAPPPPSPTR